MKTIKISNAQPIVFSLPLLFQAIIIPIILKACTFQNETQLPDISIL